MFDHEFIRVLTENMEKLEGFGIDYAQEIMEVFVQLTQQVSQDKLMNLDHFFL